MLWLRGLIPASLLKTKGEAEIYEAQLRKTERFDQVLHASKISYSDGTRGEGDVPLAVRPAGFGAATLNFTVVEGKPVVTDIQGICGEVRGEQTVPRAECWAAPVLLSCIH